MMGTSEHDLAPLIVGSAQLSLRGPERQTSEEDPEPSPDRMLAAVCGAALDDSGVGDGLLAALDSIAAIEASSWQIPDPARVIAAAIGADEAETVRVVTGGTAPIEALADACTRIQEGSARAVLIAGVECFDVLLRAMKDGRDPGFTSQPDGTEPARVLGSSGETSHPVEAAAGLIAPVAYYPLFESALRAASGRSPDEHQRYLGELWARFSAIAAENPHAWSGERRSAEQIAEPGPGNRPVSIPYTKLMNSNIQTNQAAAFVVCSRELADELGIAPRDRVRVRSTASASDHGFPGERERLDRSPALAASARVALGASDLTIGEIQHLDIYSCFPSAVEVAATELGIDPLDPGRAPSVTGGLSFAGGPGSNYVSHAIATLCERLRAAGGHALATGVGWYLTKHGVVVLSAEEADARPARGAYEHHRPQAEVDAGPRRQLLEPPASGDGTIEAYTGLFGRDGKPELGIATFLLDDGARTVAKADDEATLRALAEGDPLGARAEFIDGGRFQLPTGPA